MLLLSFNYLTVHNAAAFTGCDVVLLDITSKACFIVFYHVFITLCTDYSQYSVQNWLGPSYVERLETF